MNLDKRDFTIVRGDPVELTYFVNGKDVTAYKLIFVCKADTTLTGNRLIEKKNIAAGGDATQITAALVGADTIITVKILAIDTQAFANAEYYIDVTYQPADSSTSQITCAKGILTIEQDVSTPYDGSALPASAERYIPILLSQIADGHFAKRSGTTFVGYDLATVISSSHTHANKTLLDTYTQTEVNLADAVTKKHSHANKTILDTILQAHLDAIAQYNALYNFLINGNLDEANTTLNIDLNKSLIRIAML